jgi:hypothetical protein
LLYYGDRSEYHYFAPVGRNELKKLLENKKRAKKAIFQKLWPKVEPNTPLLVIFDPHNKASLELLFQLLEGLLVLPMQILVIRDEAPDSGKHPRAKVAWMNPKTIENRAESDEFLAAADLALLFEENHTSIQSILEKGVVPVALEKSPFLSNYHPNEETGNSFSFKALNPWDIFSALVRANETYRFPYDWQHIVRNGVAHLQ